MRPRANMPPGALDAVDVLQLLWLRRLYLAMRKPFELEFADLDLSAAQIAVLGNLCDEDGLDQRTLQERIGVTSPILTGIVDGLARRGYVERRTHPDDTRARRLFLTADGMALSARVRATIGTYQTRMLEGFSPDERALLQQMLQRIATTIGAE